MPPPPFHAPRRVIATRYVTPLREGGSLPAIVEADDCGTYVVKFRGAGQGGKALAAELIAGEIGRALSLRVPAIVFVEIDAALGRTEPDDEIRALLKASVGENLALDYLPGSLAFDPLAAPARLDDELASRIVWFDAFVGNVDRTARNTNLMEWHGEVWLIDHGASLIIHHDWPGDAEQRRARARAPFRAIATHVLLRRASAVRRVASELAASLPAELLRAIVDAVPDAWLEGDPVLPTPAAQRDAYVDYLTARLANSDAIAEEVERARALLV